jgi:4-hydroxybenzoate polyprenyltransferase
VPCLIACPLLPIWAWSAVAPADSRLLECYLIGAPLVLGLHLADTLPDLEGDRAHGVRGFAHRLGPLRARYLMWAVFLVTPALLAALAALPGHGAPLLWGAGGLTLVLVHTALVVSHGGPPQDSAQPATGAWRLAFALLACATLVAALGWLLALVVG